MHRAPSRDRAVTHLFLLLLLAASLSTSATKKVEEKDEWYVRFDGTGGASKDPDSYTGVSSHPRRLQQANTVPDVQQVPSTCSQAGTCRTDLNKAFSHCASSSTPCTILLDQGAIYDIVVSYVGDYFCPLTCQGNRVPVTLDGRGSTLLLHGPMHGVCFFEGRGVTVRNLIIDMERPHFTYGKVLSSNQKSSMIAVSTLDYRMPAAGDNRDDWLRTVQAILPYDPALQRPAASDLDIYASIPCQWIPVGKGKAHVKLEWGDLPVGQWLILRHQNYGNNALSFDYDTDVIVEDVTIYAAAGMGVTASYSRGITLRRVKVVKKEGRPMSVASDGWHFTSCRGGDVKIESSAFEGQGDDGGNIPSSYYEIRVISPDRTELQVFQWGQLKKFQAAVGDRLVFYDRASLSVLAQGLMTKAVTVASADDKSLKLSSPLPRDVKVWDLVINGDAQPATVTITDSLFKDNRARGLLLATSNVLVRGCSFEHNSGPAILVGPDSSYWWEADVIRGNWTITDSTIIGPNYGAAKGEADIIIQASVAVFGSDGVPTTEGQTLKSGQQHKGVTFRRLVVHKEQDQPFLLVRGIDGLTLDSNTILYSASKPPQTYWEVYNSVHITGVNNWCASEDSSSATKCMSSSEFASSVPSIKARKMESVELGDDGRQRIGDNRFQHHPQ